MSNQQFVDAISKALSRPRIARYESSVVAEGELGLPAIALYIWNAQVSSAFMVPLHVCEVVIRNAVSEALTEVYGATWPWSRTFEESLPDARARSGYSQRIDLISARRQQTTGKAIPELKFVFWQKMFTSRYDDRIWSGQIRKVFPHLPATKSEAEFRHEVHTSLERIRLLRNRIAHHEPVFRRSLGEEYNMIKDLIGVRCAVTAKWMDQHQQVMGLLVNR
jgi:hypothetical protein